MSDTKLAGTLGAWVTPISRGAMPEERSREVTTQYNWTAQASYDDDLSQLQNNGTITTIQGVLVDNSTNPQSVTIHILSTGQRLTCPAQSNAVFPVLMGKAGWHVAISVAAAQAGAVTRCNWVNYPVSPSVWLAPPLPAGPVIDLNFTNGSSIAALTFARAGNTATYFDNTGTLQNPVANTPRIDWGNNPGTAPLGLLIEESRVNSVTNPRAEGATPGTPGVGPTGWTIPGAGGFLTSVSVIGSGVENGIGYCDFAFVTNAAGTLELTFTNAVSSNGQSWSGSVYAKLVGGSNTNLAHAIVIYETGGTLASNSTAFTPTAANLGTQYVSVTHTNTSAGTTSETFRYHVSSAAGGASWTLRLGGPQLELGAFSTSLILPPAGTPGVSTRGGDQATIAEATNTTSGAVMVGAIKNQVTAAADLWYFLATLQNARAFFRNSGVEPACALEQTATATLDQGGSYIAAPFKHAMSFSPSQMLACVNAQPVLATPVAGVLAPTWTGFFLGTDPGFNVVFNGYIQRFRFWTRSMGAGELQAVTT